MSDEAAPWDRRGLPPVATERIRRSAAGGPRTSMLSVGSASGLATTEFEPVGEVMGSIVQNVGWRGCGAYGFASLVDAPPQPAFRPYVDALRNGYHTALHRLALEAARLGADGVVGTSLRTDHLDTGSREFVALGTAVRSRVGPHTDRPFVTELGGVDVAKPLDAGWLPVRIVYGITVLLRHDDARTRNQTTWFSGSTEVAGYTELVTAARRAARREFTRQVDRAGASGAIVSSTGVRMWEIEPSDNHRDHVAEASVFGDALLATRPRAPRAERSALTIMPLRTKQAERS